MKLPKTLDEQIAEQTAILHRQLARMYPEIRGSDDATQVSQEKPEPESGETDDNPEPS